MAKKYTKKQIVEAINFWTKILENKSPLLDDLVDDFGYGIVFNDVPVNATLKLFETVFKHVNRHLFNDKLVKWPFVKNDIECKKADALCGYVVDLLSNPKTQKFDVVTHDIIIDGIPFVPPHYAFSSELIDGHECSLILATSLLAHEMIHQFNYECENEGNIQWLDMAQGKEYNKHGENFEKCMDIANSKHGLYVTKCGYGNIQSLSRNAVHNVQQFAGTDYANESNVESQAYGHKILRHTPSFSALEIFM